MAKSTCTIDGCERKHNARGWCLPHYKKWQKYGDPLGSAPSRRSLCSVVECARQMYAKSFCKLHYARHRSHGDLSRGQERRKCTVDQCEQYRHSRGYCVKHHARWKRHGSPTARLAGEIVDGKRVCPGCGNDVPLDGYTPGSTGRCKPCVAKHKRERYVPLPALNLPSIVCGHCGKDFKPRSVRVLMCSDECANARRREVDSQYGRNNRARINEHSRRWRRNNSEKAADNSRRYRARKLGATVEDFARMDVFERDGWVCGICHEPIPKSHSFPAPLSASLDHIVPLIRGGDHSMANSQASHLRCNLSKGDRLVA